MDSTWFYGPSERVHQVYKPCFDKYQKHNNELKINFLQEYNSKYTVYNVLALVGFAIVTS